MIITLLAYVADAAVLTCYGILARGGSRRPMHWANALGSIPIAATEIAVQAWPPLVLTVAFGILGWVGVFTDRNLPATSPIGETYFRWVVDIEEEGWYTPTELGVPEGAETWTVDGKPIPFPSGSRPY